MLQRSLFIIALIAMAYQFAPKSHGPIEVDNSDESSPKNIKNNKSAVRKPASRQARNLLFKQDPRASHTGAFNIRDEQPPKKDDEEFLDTFSDKEPLVADSTPVTVTKKEDGSVPLIDYKKAKNRHEEDDADLPDDEEVSSENTASASKTDPLGFGFGSISSNGTPTITSPEYNPNSPTVDENATNGGSSSGGSQELICQGDYNSGNFDSPINLTLDCNKEASIQYCVSETGCCDPTLGTSYGLPIVVGNESKSYCVSFVGVGMDGETSVVENLNFSFGGEMPYITTELIKKYYQTTELPSTAMNIESDIFGSNHYKFGQVNLKGHNPDPAAENISCEDLRANYSTLINPVPLQLIAMLNLTVLDPNIPYEQPFDISKLIYGENFITSFVSHNYYPNLGACQTDKLVLNDFEYFQSDVTHVDSVNGISAGFSPYGFFEPSIGTLPRAPAGTSQEPQASQELEAGMFSIFH